MPKRFPPEFKRDVANVARRGDLTIAEVAADFDVSPESVRRWMRQADIGVTRVTPSRDVAIEGMCERSCDRERAATRQLRLPATEEHAGKRRVGDSAPANRVRASAVFGRCPWYL